MGTQSRGVARDLVMPTANVGRVLVGEIVLTGTRGWFLGPVGFGVV